MSRQMHEHYEVGMPWIVYGYLTSDRRTRITGRSRIQCSCAICGDRTVLTIRIPRLGRVPEPANGRHPAREKYIAMHAHPDRAHNRLLWAIPLVNIGGR